MKALKILAIIVGSAVVLLAVLIGVALTPSVQTWAVRKAIAGQAGVSGDVGHVAAGLTSANLADVRIVKDGAVITARGVKANYSAWDYLSKDRLTVDGLTIEDLVVDLRGMESTPATAPAGTTAPGEAPRAGTTTPQPAADPRVAAQRSASAPDPAESRRQETPFEGILNQASLPFDLQVAQLAINGRALLPAEQTATFQLRGANLTTGKSGNLDWTIQFSDPQTDAAVSAVRSTGSATVHIANDRRIDLVEVNATVQAEGPNLPADRVTLEAKAEQPAAGGNEGYTVRVGMERDGRIEPLLSTNAQYVVTTREIGGAWELAVRSEQVAALLAGLGLPELAATGAGKFAFKPDTTTATATGEIRGTVTRLEAISAELAPIGAMQFRTIFDGGMIDNTVRLERFNLETTTAGGQRLAQIDTLQRIAFGLESKSVSLANPSDEVARVALNELPLAWVQPFLKDMAIDGGDISLAMAIEAEPDGSRIRARSVEPLAVRAVTLRSGEEKLLDQVTISARPRVDYSATLIVAELDELSVSMPAGDSLSGKLGANVTNFATAPAIEFWTELQGKAVEALRPYLPLDPGPLAIAASTEGRFENQTVRLGKASLTATRENGAVLAGFEALQPLTLDLDTTAVSVPNATAAAARLRLGEVPLAWAEAFVPNSKFAGALTGATMEVSVRSLDDFTVTTTEPLALRGVDATLDGNPMTKGLDMLAELNATKRGDVVVYEIRRIELKQGNAALGTLTVAGEATLGEKFALSAKGNLDADAAALMNQPVAAEFATLSRGRLTTAFEATIGDTMQAKAVVAARNLVARQENRALGDVEFTVTASLKEDGSGTVLLPLTLTNAGRRSDARIEGAFGRTQDQSLILTGKITSNNIVVDDFQPLAALAPAAKAPPTPRPARDTEPFWTGAQGKVQMDLKRVLYGRDYVISNVRGGANLAPNRLSLDGLEGRFKENPFKANAVVTFNAQQPKPYRLSGTANVTNLDVGEILRAANPNEPPPLESKVTVLANLSGNGATLPDLMTGVYGRFEVTGSQGVLRALGRQGQTMGAMSSIIGIAGALRGSNTTMAVADLTSALNELRFDQFTMQVERASDLSLKIGRLEFISPTMHVTGTGGVANQGSAPMQNQPMQIQLQFGAKDQLAHLFARAGVLSQNQDEKGYHLMTHSFTIGGTPSNPDSSALWRMIGEAAARAAATQFLR